MDESDWIADALCRNPNVSPEIWFPLSFRSREARRAKSFCRVCPVRLQCLAEALKVPDTRGIWGGLDDDERDAIRKRRGALL